MLKVLRRHPLVRGCVEVLVDAALYVALLLAVVTLLGQLATVVL